MDGIQTGSNWRKIEKRGEAESFESQWTPRRKTKKSGVGEKAPQRVGEARMQDGCGGGILPAFARASSFAKASADKSAGRHFARDDLGENGMKDVEEVNPDASCEGCGSLPPPRMQFAFCSLVIGCECVPDGF